LKPQFQCNYTMTPQFSYTDTSKYFLPFTCHRLQCMLYLYTSMKFAASWKWPYPVAETCRGSEYEILCNELEV